MVKEQRAFVSGSAFSNWGTQSVHLYVTNKQSIAFVQLQL